jgi:hypothetical protein
MAINLGDNLKINAPKPTDNRYLRTDLQPYTSVPEANSLIDPAVRYVGLTIRVGTSEYWYRLGTGDADLELKNEFPVKLLDPLQGQVLTYEESEGKFINIDREELTDGYTY